MGPRLYSAKKYDVQYGGHSSFSFIDAEEIMRVIQKIGEKYPISWTGEFIAYAEEFEIGKENLARMIDDIRHAEPLIEDCSNAFIADELQLLLDQADENNDFVHFTWY